MSTKHIHTAADLVRFRASVRIECGDCGSARTMSGVEFMKLCGMGGADLKAPGARQRVRNVGGGSLAAARARMKCGRCGGKAARLSVLPPV